MKKCKQCKTAAVSKHGTKFCSRRCSVTYSNKRRTGVDYNKVKKANCNDCGTRLVVNARSSLARVVCAECRKDRKYLQARGKPRRRECSCCGKLRLKFHRKDLCTKCYRSTVSANGTFATCRPEWSRSYVRAGYRMTYCPGHPRDSGSSYVHTHVLKAERKIGRFLPKGLHVHHIDHNKLNNHKANLLVLTPSEHTALHAVERRHKRSLP